MEIVGVWCYNMTQMTLKNTERCTITMHIVTHDIRDENALQLFKMRYFVVSTFFAKQKSIQYIEKIKKGWLFRAQITE